MLILQRLKSQLSELTSEVVVLAKNPDSKRKSHLVAKVMQLEKDILNASCNPEIVLKTPSVFFKKCQKLLEIQKYKIEQIQDSLTDSDFNVTLKKEFGFGQKDADRDESLSMGVAGQIANSSLLNTSIVSQKSFNQSRSLTSRVGPVITRPQTPASTLQHAQTISPSKPTQTNAFVLSKAANERKKLERIESEFRSVNNLYDSIN